MDFLKSIGSNTVNNILVWTLEWLDEGDAVVRLGLLRIEPQDTDRHPGRCYAEGIVKALRSRKFDKIA
jgi:hypothetical protein